MRKALDSMLLVLTTVAIATFLSDALTQLSYAQANTSSFQSLDNTIQTTNASNSESQRDDVLSRSSTWLHKWTDSSTDPDGQIRIAGKQISSEEEELHEQKTKSNKRILLVDDEPDTCMVYQIVLEDAGYDASHIPILLKHWKNSDLIITAWLSSISKCLYLMDELCKKIREVDKTAKIIFITAGEGYYEQLRIQAYTDLINDANIKYIQKSITNEELVRLVTTLY